MNKTKITALFLSIFLIVSCFTSFGAVAATEEGATFTKEDLFFTSSPLSKLPSTYEATIRFPEGTAATTRGGVIAGDFLNMTTACFSFEIHQNGNPRLYFIDSNKTTYSFIFNKVNVYTGEWVHLAIVKDSVSEELICYVNGEEAQTLVKASPASLTLKSSTCIGGDNRPENAQYFKGSIKNVAFYSDIRSAAEIKADAAGTLDKDNLIGSYNVVQDAKVLKDVNGSGPDFSSRNPWLEKEPVTDYAYSFAVVGDTQTLNYYYQDKLVSLYSWIASNVEAKKIKYVMGLGDITDKDQPSEWTLAKNLMKMLDSSVPYSIVRGNHDSAEKLNKYFPYSEYGSKVTGSFDGTMLNTYHKFVAGNNKYLLVNLDMGPSDEVLEWANKIVSENPDHNVIVTTHVYLYHDGTTLDKGDNAAASNLGGHNDGDDIWNKFVKKHKNIVLVLSGHDPYDKIVTTQTKGENGNVVTQMLIDPQHTDKTFGGAGLVAMLYFSEDGSHVDVEYISTANNAYYLEENQFSIDLAVVEASAVPTETEPETQETTDTPDTSVPETTDENNKKEPEATGFDPLIIVGTVGGLVVGFVVGFILGKKKKSEAK
ncbi:MAG: metallophosphoesterase [Clostridia bacterium]|nr:metallophosphoesterase [Clostridia bacterium]